MQDKKVFFIILLFQLLLISNNGICSPTSSNTTSGLETDVLFTWNLPEQPIDVVHSLDGKYVFILTKEKNVLIYTAQGSLEGTIKVDPGISAIDIAPRAEFLYLINGDKKTFSAMSIDFIRKINISGSPSKGPENARVTLVLFTDFECPYCRKVEPLLEQVLKRYPNDVKLVFKNMPLQFHKFADPSARAALAAEEQGKFWEFHDELFAVEKLDEAVIDEIAEKLSLDIEKWKKDMTSPTVLNKLRRDMQDAQNAGVTGTPTIFVNGRLLKQRSMQGFQQIIDEELNKK